MARDRNITGLKGCRSAWKLAGLPVINSRHNPRIKIVIGYKHKHDGIKPKAGATVAFLLITKVTAALYLPTLPLAESVTTTFLTFLSCRPLLLCVPLVCSQMFSSTCRGALCVTLREPHFHPSVFVFPPPFMQHWRARQPSMNSGRVWSEQGWESVLLVFLGVAVKQFKTLTVSQLQQTSQTTFLPLMKWPVDLPFSHVQWKFK